MIFKTKMYYNISGIVNVVIYGPGALLILYV